MLGRSPAVIMSTTGAGPLLPVVLSLIQGPRPGWGVSGRPGTGSRSQIGSRVQPHDAEADGPQNGVAECSWSGAKGDEPESLVEKHRGRVRLHDGIELDRRESASPRPADHVGGEGSSHAFAPGLLGVHQAAGRDVASRAGPVRVPASRSRGRPRAACGCSASARAGLRPGDGSPPGVLPAPQPEGQADDDGGDDQNGGEHRRTDPYRGVPPCIAGPLWATWCACVQVCPQRRARLRGAGGQARG